MPIRPLRTKLIVRALNEHLSVMAIFATFVRGIDCIPDGLSLRAVRPIVLPVELNLPLTIVEYHEVLQSRH